MWCEGVGIIVIRVTLSTNGAGWEGIHMHWYMQIDAIQLNFMLLD